MHMHSEIKTKTVNTIQFPYLDLSQNVKICDVPYSLKSPRNSEWKSNTQYRRPDTRRMEITL